MSDTFTIDVGGHTVDTVILDTVEDTRAALDPLVGIAREHTRYREARRRAWNAGSELPDPPENQLIIGFDTETEPFERAILGADGVTAQLYAMLRYPDGSLYDKAFGIDLRPGKVPLEAIADQLAELGPLMAAANAAYDSKVVWRGIDRRTHPFWIGMDVERAERFLRLGLAVDPKRRTKPLSLLAMTEFGVQLGGKGAEQMAFRKDAEITAAMWRYAIIDAVVTGWLGERYLERLERLADDAPEGAVPLRAFENKMRSTPALFEMEFTGIPYDQDRHVEESLFNEQQLQSVAQEFAVAVRRLPPEAADVDHDVVHDSELNAAAEQVAAATGQLRAADMFGTPQFAFKREKLADDRWIREKLAKHEPDAVAQAAGGRTELTADDELDVELLDHLVAAGSEIAAGVRRYRVYEQFNPGLLRKADWVRRQLNRHEPEKVRAATLQLAGIKQYKPNEKRDARLLTPFDELNKLLLFVLSHYHDSRLATLLLEFRRLDKLVGTYGPESFGEYVTDERLHGEIIPMGTDTSREASNKPNMQNIAPEVVEYLGKQPGRAVTQADYATLELHIVAETMQVVELSEALAAGRDLHQDVAIRMWGEEKGGTKSARQAAKGPNYGSAYGMSDAKLAEQSTSMKDPTTRKQADELLQRHRKALPSLTEAMAARDRFIEQLAERPPFCDWTATLRGYEVKRVVDALALTRSAPLWKALAAPPTPEQLHRWLVGYHRPGATDVDEALERLLAWMRETAPSVAPEASTVDALEASGREEVAEAAKALAKVKFAALPEAVSVEEARDAFAADKAYVLAADGQPLEWVSWTKVGTPRRFTIPVIGTGALAESAIDALVLTRERPQAADQLLRAYDAEFGIDYDAIVKRTGGEDPSFRQKLSRSNQIAKKLKSQDDRYHLMRWVVDQLAAKRSREGLSEREVFERAAGTVLYRALSSAIKSAKNQYRNHPIQGGGAETMAAGLATVWHEVMPQFPRAELLLTVHDSLYASAPVEEIVAFHEAVLEALKDGQAQMYPASFPEVDGDIADSLGKTIWDEERIEAARQQVTAA